MAWRVIGVSVSCCILLSVCCWRPSSGAEDSRFAMTHSRSQYVHWIDLYDAQGKRIDPDDPAAAPYSPVHTCGRCHDYKAMTHGHHFNAMTKLAEKGRPGEPWIWTDAQTGTQIPLSYRGWEGTYDPRDLGISAWDFTLKFGRHMPGGGPGSPADVAEVDAEATSEEEVEDAETAKTEDEATEDEDVSARDMEQSEPEDNGRWHLSGELSIDCMMCHGQHGAYSPEKWWDQIEKQNFAWAPAVALGIADVDGDVSRIKEVDPAPKTEDGDESAAAGPELPTTTYRLVRLDAQKKVFFDVIRKPSNNVCYYCHTTRSVGEGSEPQWTHDEDVHLRAGMSCTDCHRNGVGHHTVRGFEGEEHPTGKNVATLSCRGCHMDREAEDGTPIPGGRLGAPKPLHKGLPPLHFEKLSCTACHSGPGPKSEAPQVQTALAHGLGLPSHHIDASVDPQMVAPVMLRTDGKMLYPHRMVWPAFWGEMKGENVTPLNPVVVNEALKRTLRVRRSATFTETLGKVSLSKDEKVAAIGEASAAKPVTELTDEEKAKLDKAEAAKAAANFLEKLGEALVALKEVIKTEGAQPVYIAGGRGYRLGGEDKVEKFESEAAKPYAWKLAHDVRPARWSAGATRGCFDCHDTKADIFYGNVTARGPAIDPEPPTSNMVAMADYDPTQIDAWNQSFQGRTLFKWFGFASAAVVAIILLSFVFLGVNGVFGLFRRR